MPQNYLFFCQDVPFELRSPRPGETIQSVEEVWNGIQGILHGQEKTSESPGFWAVRDVVAEDQEGMWADLMQRSWLLEAGGGLIYSENQMLWILRHGRWDLPKGKAEPGETMLETAIRECVEECGLVDLTSLESYNKLETNHLYLYKGRIAWKRSHWFTMTCPMDRNQQLHPQIEEGITEVRWMSPEEVQSVALPRTYPSVRSLLLGADPGYLKGLSRF